MCTGDGDEGWENYSLQKYEIEELRAKWKLLKLNFG